LKKVCLIGQFPPPLHGLSKALETIKDSSYFNNKFKVSKIDITNNKKIFSHLKEINNSNVDIYYFTISHSKLGNARDLIILIKLLRKKKKIVIHYHGGYFKELYKNMNLIQKSLNKRILAKVDNIIVLGERLRTLFSDIVPNSKIRVCENFVEDSSLLSEVDFKDKIINMKSNDSINVLYLSNFIKSKGYNEVLKVAKNLKGKPIKFHFAGKFFSEIEEKEFKSYIKNNQLSNVIYYGVVEGSEKKNLLKECEVFILPTYYHIEGQPVSIIESMANGLTIITTNHAGIPDISGIENGYIVEPKNINDIEVAIIDLLNNREKLLVFALHNREYALLNLKEIDYIKRIEKILNEV
jgi:glycosyltransferase involved in cell wall biosynthesis